MFAEQQLGILVDPSSVRLIPRPEDRYIWIRRPEREHLFQRQLSKHGVRSYVELCREIGISIDVIPSDPAAAEIGTDGVEVCCICYLFNGLRLTLFIETECSSVHCFSPITS